MRMQRSALRHLLGLGLCGAAAGCQAAPPLADYPLDGITVFVGFDEPICGGTFDWIEARLRWLVAETGLPASEAPIRYYWTREDTAEHCSSIAGGCAKGSRLYAPLEVLSHEMVHGHLSQLGLPRPWLTEGIAELLQDERWDLSEAITLPSALLEVSEPQLLDYEAAASFVRYLRDRFGMPALLELYAALDGIDVKGTPDVFRAVLGVTWDDVESGYLAAYMPIPVGSINCDFPELAPEAGAWTIPVDSPCEDAGTIGPFLGWYDTDIPYSERYVTLNVPEAGVYTVSLTSSADVSIVLIDCDEPLEYYSRYDSRLDDAIADGARTQAPRDRSGHRRRSCRRGRSATCAADDAVDAGDTRPRGGLHRHRSRAFSS
jgi:hypothetical protein